MAAIRVRVGVAVLRGDEILLARHRKAGEEYWVIPGGGVEVGETLAQAAAREMSEETGYTVAIGRLLFVAESIAPDASRHLVHVCFAGEITGGEECAGCDERLIGIGWLPVERLSQERLYPAFGAELLAALQGATGAHYAGSRWV